jgi:predicted amidohydrolase/tetratricopeptide (TPR) repeat protein
LCLYELLYATSDGKEKQLTAQEAADYSKQAISVLSELGDNSELVLAYSVASLHSWYAANISEQEGKRNELAQESLSYSEKAVALSKDFDDPYYTAMSRWAAAFSTLFFSGKIEVSLQYAKEMLEQGSIARDNYLKGVACYLLTFITDWMKSRESIASKKKERCEEIIRYAREAIHYLTLVSQDFMMAETHQLYVESYSSLACDVEANVENKRVLQEKAVRIARKGLEYAVRSGSPDAMGSALHALSKALHFYANLQSEKGKKRKLLREGLINRNKFIEFVQASFPSNYWIFGVGKYYAASMEADLARLEENRNKKIVLLEKAILDMQDGVSNCKKWISSRASPFHKIIVAEYQDTFGDILCHLYSLDHDKTNLVRAIEVYNDSAKKYKEADLPSRAAESYWKMARNKDQLGKPEEAAESFEDASRQYNAATKKIQQFADFYEDYAIYMKAWTKIEKAKAAHKREEYANAQQHYQEATSFLTQSKPWSYLSPNFHAWSLLEHAEDLSRKESNTKSIDAFREAARLFEEIEKHIKFAHSQLQSFEARDEKAMVIELVEISNIRREYCVGRIAIEEAKILDRQGDHASSSQKYASASKIFQKIVEGMKHEADRQEFRPIVFVCKAWQMMTQAEAEASPDFYLKAAEIFDEAKEHSLNERAKILALGNSRFCKALEAGTRFEATRDKKLHLTATQHLESAANYYIKAGFKTASEYAVATRRLLDGYIYMDSANIETDPEKKARYYVAAERVLQTSVESYLRAQHPEKAQQVRQLLDRVREERTLVTSLNEVLHAPTVASSTTSFATPTSTRENAVGLERFDHTNVQAHLTIPEEVTMNDSLQIQIDLVNVAKNPGLLIRIDDILPKGFILTETPLEYNVKDGSIDLGGKKFEPLKVESIRVSARATDFGIFKVSPQVIFIDEAGKFRTCSPRPMNIKVQAPAPIAREKGLKRKYELVYKDLLREYPRMPKSNCRVAIAQIVCSKSGDVLNEFYEEKTPGLFGLRKDKIEAVRLKVKNMIETAHAKGVNVLLFPELTVDLSYSILLRDITDLAKAYEMYIIPGSYHDQKTKRNISIVIGPNGILWRQEKHIPAVIHHKGKRFNEGIDVAEVPRKIFVCNTEFGRIAIAICRDFLDMDLRVELKNFDPAVDIVLNPAFTPVTADFKAVHFDARRSIYAYCFFANVAEFGDSTILTPEKERVERTVPAGEESIIFKDVDFFSLRLARKKWETEKKRERKFIQSTR